MIPNSSKTRSSKSNNNMTIVTAGSIFWFSLTVIFFLSLNSFGKNVVVVAEPTKKEAKCRDDITRGKALKELIMEKNVLVALQEKTIGTSDDDDDNENKNDDDEEAETEDPLDEDGKQYKELCTRLKNTPYERIKDLEIVAIKESPLQKRILSKATTAVNAKGEKPNFGSEFSSNKDDETTNFWDFAFDQLDWLAKQIGLGGGSSYEDVMGENDLTLDYNTLPPHLPEYILFTKGNYDKALRFVPDDFIKSADSVSDFVSRQLKQKKIGNFVYSLETYDLIVSEFMKSIKLHNENLKKKKESSGTNTGGGKSGNDVSDRMKIKVVQDGSSETNNVGGTDGKGTAAGGGGVSFDLAKAYGWAYSAKAVQLMQEYHPGRLFSSSSSSTKDYDGFAYNESSKLSSLYVKTIFNILDKGVDYPDKQIERVTNMLESDSSSLSDMKKEDLHQKVYTLKKFVEPADPKKITEEKVNSFVKFLFFNFLLYFTILILLPVVLLFPVGYNDDEYDDDDDYDEVDAIADEFYDTDDEDDNNNKKPLKKKDGKKK